MANSALSFVDPAACCYENSDKYKYSSFCSANGATYLPMKVTCERWIWHLG